MSLVDAESRNLEREQMPVRLGKYEVRAQIGEGGMASVYVGHDGKRAVALKVIKEEYSRNREFVDMFLDEGKIVSGLKHPNLIEVHELGSEGERLFIAMELLRGYSLWQVWTALRERKLRLHYETVAWIGARIGDALHHAHEAKDSRGKPLGVVHRDVNASNIFLTYDGQVKVIDFGLAKAGNRVSKTAAGVVKGKFAYMSPEQALGKPIDRRTDVFALAVTLWELTVDQRLFKGKDDFETLRRVHQAHVRDPRTQVEGYPDDLAAILLKALDRDRAKRHSTARELSAVLDAFATSGARDVGQSHLSDVMHALFEPAKDRDHGWLAEAIAQDKPAPRETLRPIVRQTQSSESGEEPPAAASELTPNPSDAPAPPTAVDPEPALADLFAPPAVRPPSTPDEDAIPELPQGDLQTFYERTPRLKRAAMIGAAILLLLGLAMLLGALWGDGPG